MKNIEKCFTLAELLKNSSAKYTVLEISGRSNKFGDAEAKEVAKALKGNKTIQVVDLDNNKISDRGAEDLAEAFKCSNIKIVCLRGNNISDGYKWRKYGQKLLTASKLHREYLRCTFPGCPARKHIEVVPATREVVAVSSSKHNHPPLTATNDQSPKSDGIVSEPEKNEASEKLGADEKHV